MSSKDMQQHPDVEISVRNFGPVSEANINLRPLTAFIGPSNTGKTYLSSLIYALHGAFDGFSAFLNHFIQDSLGDIVYMWHNQPSEAQKESLPIFKKLNTEGRPFKFSDLPQEIRDIVIHVENEFDFRGKPEKRCDRLLFFINTEQKLVAAPIELKSGKATESDAIEKLENSLKFVQSITTKINVSRIEYCPMLFHGRGIKSRSSKGFKQLIVQFRGKKLQVLIGKCGAPKNLVNILSNSGYL